MALQTSGAISLNDIHVEAGGTTGTSASINDADIRDLIGKASGAQSSFSEFYGASAVEPFASWTTSWGAITTSTIGKTTINTAPYTNNVLPLRGGYNLAMGDGVGGAGDAIVGGNGYTGLNLPTLQSGLALASNPIYQFYLSLSPTLVAGPVTGTDILGGSVTNTFWALDPTDFGYQSATFQGLTVTFHKATAADVPAPDANGILNNINGLSIRRQQYSGTEVWWLNLAGTVTGTPISGATWLNGIGFESGTAAITGLTLTLNGYP
jgi:hypothetical protein